MRANRRTCLVDGATKRDICGASELQLGWHRLHDLPETNVAVERLFIWRRNRANRVARFTFAFSRAVTRQIRLLSFVSIFLVLARVMVCTITMRIATTDFCARRGHVTGMICAGVLVVRAAPQRGVRKDLYNYENGKMLLHVTSCYRYPNRAASLLRWQALESTA